MNHRKMAQLSSGRLFGLLKVAVLFLLIVSSVEIQAADKSFEQSRVTVKVKDATLGDVLWEIHKQTDFTFMYSTDDIKAVKIGSLNLQNASLEEALEACLNPNGLTYSVSGDVITISVAPKVTSGRKAVPQERKPYVGSVVDDAGLPVAGANILIKGTRQGGASDADGYFSIDYDSDEAVMVVSFLGFSTREVKMVPGTPVKITLMPDMNMMEEVIVTGYGSFKKSAYAGSATNVKAEKIKDVPATSFTEMLQGNATGVQFSAPSGQPGAASDINIRGMGSFNASNQPLYVIDGVPVRSGSVNSLSSDAELDIMSTINSSDIESMTIIKDAAAASLYGSRAANGVILITTKRGKSGKPQIALKADWGWSDFAMEYRPVMSGEQRREYIYNALKNGQLRDGESEADAIAYADEEIENYAPIPWCGYIDWDDILFKKGSHQNYEASISGGTDKFNYYSSIAYLRQDGIAINSGLDRISGRLNVDYQATKRFRLGANMLFAVVNQDVYSEGTSYTAPFYASRNCVVPSDAVYNEDGSWDRDFIRNSDRNPLLSATYDYQRENVTRSFNTIYGQYEFIRNLIFKSTFSYDYTNTKGSEWSDPRTSNGDDINGGLTRVAQEYKKMVWANQLSYRFDIADDHHFDALIGYEIDDQYSDYISASASNFATPDKHVMSNGMTVEAVGGSDTRTRMVSYISRLNYDYKNRYYLGGSFRTDGSSRLHKDNRWGNFWSVSAAYRIIEEPFMAEAKNWLSDLKFRVSYGVNGTLPSDYYGYMGLSSLNVGFIGEPGISLSQIANKDLKWESNHNLNVGLDFGFANRVNFTLEYYTRNTRNLLMDRPISMTTGFGSYLMNVGEVMNTGVEFEVNSVNIQRQNFTWTTSFNISHNRNEIVNLDGQQTEIISGTQIRKVGYPYRTFYVMEFAGINPDTGVPQFYTNDLDEDGNYVKDITEDPSDANRIPWEKNAEPDVVGGLNNTFRYRWFDLSFLIGYQFGGYAYDIWWQKTEHGGEDLEANIPIYYLDSWKKPGDVTQYEQFIEGADVTMSSYITSRSIHSTDYIRLKNITFGVTLPKIWTRKAKIETFRLFASANNLWTWAKYDYYDPEAVRNGGAIWGTPPLKTITFGVNLTF